MIEKDRYIRQLVLPEIGEKGQERLKDSKVLIIGAGGLGSPVASIWQLLELAPWESLTMIR